MSDVQIPEAFQLDSGLREDMVITIHSAYFAPHADYQDGHQLLLFLIGTDESNEPVELRMSVGADWTTADGTTIAHPTKKRQQINKNSIYGHWLSYSFQLPNLAKELIERSDTLGGKGPLDARIWNDLILSLENREIEFGKNIDPQNRLMPIEFIGTYNGETLAAVGAQPVPTTPGPSATDPMEVVRQAQLAKAQSQAAVSNGSPLYAKALQLAKQSPDFATFLATALADSDILADDELAVQCADQSQLWAAAH
jgi:hypothetical protein